MNDPDFIALAKLVREARAEDARTLAASIAANDAWKAANAVLTDRLKVLNGYLTELVNKHTLLPTDDAGAAA